MKFIKDKTGFTFIETMVVIALLGILSVSLFSSFAMGMKVWKRAASFNLAERKSILTLERMARELREVFNYSAIGFQGNKTHIEFANIFNNTVYNVSYTYVPEENSVKRSSISRQQMAAQGEAPRARGVIPDVKDLAFSFYGPVNQTGNATFSDAWNSSVSGVPEAVKVSVTLKDGKNLEKITPIPIVQ